MLINDSELISDLRHHLFNASRVLIVTHQQPDCDAIGSCLAWSLQLAREGISSYIWTAERLYDQFDYLPSIGQVQQTMPRFTDFDTLLVLDCSSISRVKDLDSLRLDLGGMTVINIDHHPDNTYFGDVNLVYLVSSVGELSTLLFSSLGWELTPDIATCLYAAVLFDTGCFTNTNVTAQTFSVCSELMEAEASVEAVTTAMYESYSLASYETLRIGLDRLQMGKGYAWTSIPKSASEGPMKIIDFVRKLTGIQVAMVLREMDDDVVKVNLRSKTDFSVSKFAAQFGGGGHHKASGIFMRGSLVEVEHQLCEALDAALLDPSFQV